MDFIKLTAPNGKEIVFNKGLIAAVVDIVAYSSIIMADGSTYEVEEDIITIYKKLTNSFRLDFDNLSGKKKGKRNENESKT